MSGYEYIPHTADAGIRAHGRTKVEAFENAARGMMSIICNPKSVKPLQTVSVAISSDEDESLLVDWLSELLYLQDSRDLLFCEFSISELAGGRLQAEVKGETIDPGRHELRSEIKAVTNHLLLVAREDHGWLVQVIFDL